MVSRAVIGGVVVVAIIAVAGLLAFPGILPGGQPAAEGTVLVYGSIDAEDIQPVIDAFENANPDINIEYVRGSPSEILTRITTELDAGQNSADMTLVSFPGTLQMIREGIYQPYRSPEANAYPPELRDANGLWTSVILLGQVIVYNTDLIPENELPQTLDDLTDPKWKGFITMHDYTRGTTSTQIWGSMAERLGQDGVVNFLTKLEANVEPVRQRSTGAQVDEVARGEYKIGIVGQLHDVVGAQLDGAPVAILELDDFPVMQSPTPAAILETAENVRGAQVFVDFLLSERGQIIFGNVEVRIAARPGVNTRFTFDDLVPAGSDVFQYPTQDVFDNIDDWTERFRAIAGI